MEEKKEEYYIRVGVGLKELFNQMNNEWEKKNGFRLSFFDMGELLAKKIHKAGGIRL